MKKNRKPLSAGRIADAALALIDKKGLDGFSFRGLARVLGCEAMSIYHYYPSKAHLFDELVASCIREIEFPPAGADWLEQLRLFSQSFRRQALRHPGFFLYFAIYRMNNRAGLAFLDRLLSLLQLSGLPPERRAVHFRSVGYYLMGAGLDEAMGYIKGPSAAEPVPADEARRDFPAITAVGPYFSKDFHEQTFNDGLEALLANLKRDAERHAA